MATHAGAMVAASIGTPCFRTIVASPIPIAETRSILRARAIARAVVGANAYCAVGAAPSFVTHARNASRQNAVAVYICNAIWQDYTLNYGASTMARALTRTLATVRAHAAVFPNESHETITSAVAADAVVAARIHASRHAAIIPTPLDITRAITPHTNAVSRAVDAQFRNEPRAVRHVTAIRARPLGIARAITERAHSVTTAIAGAGLRQRAVGAVPAQVAGARAVET